MSRPQQWRQLVGGIGRTDPIVAAPQAQYATAAGRRRRKAKPAAPVCRDRPTPEFSWHPWECNLRALWNMLLFGTFWEFDWRRLMHFYGLDVPPEPDPCACPG